MRRVVSATARRRRGLIGMGHVTPCLMPRESDRALFCLCICTRCLASDGTCTCPHGCQCPDHKGAKP